VLLERIGTKEAGVALTKVMEETAAYSSQTRGASLEAANSIQRGMMEDGRLPESTALGIKILTSLAVAEKRGRL
jgi:hypothetical protein